MPAGGTRSGAGGLRYIRRDAQEGGERRPPEHGGHEIGEAPARRDHQRVVGCRTRHGHWDGRQAVKPRAPTCRRPSNGSRSNPTTSKTVPFTVFVDDDDNDFTDPFGVGAISAFKVESPPLKGGAAAGKPQAAALTNAASAFVAAAPRLDIDWERSELAVQPWSQSQQLPLVLPSTSRNAKETLPFAMVRVMVEFSERVVCPGR